MFTDQWREMYGEDLFDRAGSEEAIRLCELLCGPSCDLVFDRIYDVLSSRPKTLLHGDMRADNVFRSDLLSGDGRSELTFIDWQLTHVGPPGPELTEAWVTSLDPEVRRQDLTMLRAYRSRLVELNPTAESYTYEMLIEDYALAHCFWLTTLITAGAATLASFDRPETSRMKRLWARMMTRVLTAVTDHSCLARVESLLNDA
jgi:aminoglycoside phosphotransferase (APT) family kinase protein